MDENATATAKDNIFQNNIIYNLGVENVVFLTPVMRNNSFSDVMFTSSKYCVTICFRSCWFTLIISSTPSSPFSSALEIRFFCGSMK